MANWESEIREAILRHGQFSSTCLEQDPVKRNRDNLVKNWRKKNPDKVFPTVLICLNLCAMVPYINQGNLKMSVYWFAAALLNFALTWL